jgi:hypothetical protein
MKAWDAVHKAYSSEVAAALPKKKKVRVVFPPKEEEVAEPVKEEVAEPVKKKKVKVVFPPKEEEKVENKMNDVIKGFQEIGKNMKFVRGKNFQDKHLIEKRYNDTERRYEFPLSEMTSESIALIKKTNKYRMKTTVIENIMTETMKETIKITLGYINREKEPVTFCIVEYHGYNLEKPFFWLDRMYNLIHKVTNPADNEHMESDISYLDY